MIEKYKNLEPREKNIADSIMIVVVSLLIVGLVLLQDVIDARKAQLESQKTVLVTDNSRYFTVLGCAKKFLNVTRSGNASNAVLLLDSEYVEMNRITNNNVFSYLPKLDSTMVYDYIGEEMYQHKISKNVTEYFINGKIKSNMMDEDSNYVDYDMTITLFESTFTFTVKPGIGDLHYEE